jgi:hypothetical protein
MENTHTLSSHCATRQHLVEVCLLLMLLAFLTPPSFAATVAGETYVYRVLNGYNKETRANVSYRIDKVAANRVDVSVSADRPAVELNRTEVHTADGNWLRHVLVSHDQPHEFEFSPPYPAYVFPLEAGKSWSTRVNGVDLTNGRRRSVRIDAKVLGTERISVPAGEFEAVKIRRTIYVGDGDGFRSETRVMEIEWYAPSVGRAVRLDTKSAFYTVSSCGDHSCPEDRGDWNIYELVSRAEAARAAASGPPLAPTNEAVPALSKRLE